MPLTRLVLDRPALIFVFVALMLLGGVFAAKNLVVQALPATSPPTIQVSLSYAGGSTTFIRENIVAPLENEIAGGPGLDHMDSTVQAGQATITCTFRLGSDPTADLGWVQRSVASAGSQLPSDLLAPYIRIANPADAPVVSLALTSKTLSPERLAQLANSQIMPAIENTDGVSDAAVRGLPQAAYNVIVDPALLVAANLTLSDVISTIQTNNVRAPGGIAYGKKETQIDVRGDLPTPPMIAALPIRVTSALAGGASQISNGVSFAGSPTAGMNAAQPSSSAEAAIPATASASTSNGAAQVQSPTLPTSVAAASAPSYAQSSSMAQSSATAGGRLAVPAPALPSTAPVPRGPMPSMSGVVMNTAPALATTPLVGSLKPWTALPSNRSIGDFATVQYGSTPVRLYNSLNGEPGVGMDIHKFDTASEITVADAVVKQLPNFHRQFPDVNFRVDHVAATFSAQQVEGVVRTIIEGIALVALVMLFFLRSWRNAVVVLIAIPTSLGVTLLVMHVLNYTLDVISLLAMSLVVGTLIDDSTVVLENIERHRHRGESPIVAALKGRGEIGNAAIVITLVDVVVFLPIAFLSGPVGRQLSEFGVVVAVATVTSLFVSFTVTPALAGLWSMRSTWKPWPVIEAFNELFERLRRWYARTVLINAFRRPAPWIVATIVLLVGAFSLIPLGVVGQDYIPAGDRAEVFAQFTFPPGTPLEDTRRLLQPLDRELNREPGFEAVESSFGGYYAPFGGFIQAGNTAEIHLYVKPGVKMDDVLTHVRSLAAHYAHGAETIVYQATSQNGGAAQPIDLLVTTNDGSEPATYANRVADVLRATPGARDVVNSATNVSPQVEVVFNREVARTMDVSIGTASTAIRAAFGGAVASQITTPDGLVQIDVIYPRSDRGSLDGVLQTPIRTNSGAIVHVGDVATLRYVPTPNLLTREDRQNVVHVSANLQSGAQLSNVLRDFRARLAAAGLPASVSVAASANSSSDMMNQTLILLAGSLAASFVLVYLLMVALYNDFRMPLIIVLAIPPAAIGALVSLAITHQSLNLYSLIGSILLVGLVTKNGILLVDYANTLRRQGRGKTEAIFESARTRFRPILMTTLAMVVGMLPVALALEPGAAVRRSLGIVVIGGLLSSLILTLVIVPIVYRWLAPKRVKIAASPVHEAPPAPLPSPVLAPRRSRSLVSPSSRYSR
ncbi:MAG TPA: efflux RND transporter permease subunit [Candidatus Acidoferrum sp.]|nr:efflux RND transporter permease subunit [Candidatus Acidoferrum sp.]